ncbi:MAG: alpha/beta hydrolase-fold protein [Rhizorhabdus sp.]
MPDTEVFDLTAADDGQVYRIFVSRPSQPAPSGGFPVLTVLDGNALFAAFAAERRVEEFGKQPGGAMIVVGVGYPNEQVYDLPRRIYDMTPPWPGKVPASMAPLAGMKTGGNEHLARFLIEQLRPEIARRYQIAANRQSLFGHSLGGLFALHMLYTRPGAFDAIVAASPSQWWLDQAILAEERAFIKRLAATKITAPARLLLLTGEHDETAAITWDAEALARRLEPFAGFGLRTKFESFSSETHLTTPFRAVPASIRFVAGVS